MWYVLDMDPTGEIALLTMLIQEGMYLSDEQDREIEAEEVPAK